MTRRPNKATERLAAAASTHGIQVSARQIERWRQLGLIARPVQRRLGRGRGSESVYPDEAPAQAAEIASLLVERRRLDDVALLLFLRGFEIEEAKLREAYKAYIANLRQRIVTSSRSKDPLTIAEAATKELLRSMRGDPRVAEWRARLEGKGETGGSILESAIINFIHILLVGRPASDEGFAEFLEAGGIIAAAAEMASATGEPLSLEAIGPMISKLDLAEFVRLVDSYSSEQLRAAADTLRRLLAFADRFVAVTLATTDSQEAYGFGLLTKEMTESAMAFGLPLAAWIFERNADGLALLLAAIAEAEPRLEATAILFEYLPERYWRFLGAEGEAALDSPEEERVQLSQLVRGALQTDPRLRELSAVVAA